MNELVQTSLFEESLEQEQFKNVRRIPQDGQVWFPIVDIIEHLTKSDNPLSYWSAIKKREKIELSTNCRPFKMKALDNKNRLFQCVNLEGAFRIIQSVPSPKAEPIKQWMAKVARERIEEMANPELAIRRGTERATRHYLRKGHTEEWAKERVEGITKRNFLTDEWKARGAIGVVSILTNISHTGAFGLTTKEHRGLKGIPEKASLRDNMMDVEVSWTGFVEVMQRERLKKTNATTIPEIQKITADTARLAARMRKEFESENGTPIATPDTPSKIRALTEPKQIALF